MLRSENLWRIKFFNFYFYNNYIQRIIKLYCTDLFHIFSLVPTRPVSFLFQEMPCLFLLWHRADNLSISSLSIMSTWSSLHCLYVSVSVHVFILLYNEVQSFFFSLSVNQTVKSDVVENVMSARVAFLDIMLKHKYLGWQEIETSKNCFRKQSTICDIVNICIYKRILFKC